MKVVMKNVPLTDLMKIYSAARINGIRLGEKIDIGGDKCLVPLDYRAPEELIEFGKSLVTVTGKEFDKQIAAEKAAAEARKKAQA